MKSSNVTSAGATSDNSSENSTSNVKKKNGDVGANSSTKSEIEIVDQKIIKCINEINFLKQKMQREWSKQMSNHLKGFYPDAHSDSINSSINSNNQNDSNIASPVSSLLNMTDSSEYEKKISLITKKLRSYEKRRQKLFFESKKNQDKSETTTTGENVIESKEEPMVTINESDKRSKSGSSNTINTGSGSGSVKETPIGLGNQSTPHQLIHSNTTGNLLNVPNVAQQRVPSDEILFNQFKSFNLLNGESPLTQNINNEPLVTTAAITNTNSVKASFSNVTNASNNVSNNQSVLNPFYLSSELNANDLGGANSETTIPNEDNLGSTVINNKSNNSLDRERNVMFYQVQQQLFFLKLQQEKIQTDFEDMQKKMLENHQTMLKELQHTCSQISEPVHKLSFNLFKSYEQKLEDLKTSFDRSLTTFTYNLTHCHRDVKETRDEVVSMKSKMDFLEKNQNEIIGKGQNIETSNPTNYYQLFYKLLDILLTLATIILLAFTNMIASIKFVFLLYPRSIVIFIFIYLFFFYLIDYDLLFHHLLQNTNMTNFNYLKLNNNNKKLSNISYITKFVESIYNLVFNSKQ